MKKAKKEIVIDLADIQYLYGFYKLMIKKLELPSFTGMHPDGLSDFLREPWEEDRNVRIINVSKTTDGVRNELDIITNMFKRVKEFQKRCGNEFTWSVEQ